MTLGQELRDAMRKRRPDVVCLSGVCYLRLDGGNLAKAEFVSRSGNYDGLRLTVLNRRTGPVDTLTVHLGDLPRSAKSTASDDAENVPWDIYRPLPNIDALTEVVEEYLNLFRDPDSETR